MNDDPLPALIRALPLPEGASAPEAFTERVEIGGLQLHLVGLCCEYHGRSFTGSAADPEQLPWDRAYFELLERVSLGVAQAGAGDLELRSATGAALGRVPVDRVFVESPAPDRYRYSLSNGVAAGPNWMQACQRAWAEGVERDAVLRSWHRELRLGPLEPALLEAWRPLESLYELELRQIAWRGLTVVVAVGFPHQEETPTCLAFAARPEAAAASDGARAEFLQRLGFLFGESVPETAPDVTPTPDFHQEQYLWSGARSALREWLAGESLAPSSVASDEPPEAYVDLTPPELRGKLHVARIWHPGLWPLVFGQGFRWPSPNPPIAPVHPIA